MKYKTSKALLNEYGFSEGIIAPRQQGMLIRLDDGRVIVQIRKKDSKYYQIFENAESAEVFWTKYKLQVYGPDSAVVYRFSKRKGRNHLLKGFRMADGSCQVKYRYRPANKVRVLKFGSIEKFTEWWDSISGD